MAIEILGLREFAPNKISHTFWDKNWRANSVAELLLNPDKYVSQIPEEERYNIYFTVHDCIGVKARMWKSQSVIPFDIDSVDITKVEETAKAACEIIGINFHKTGIICSGRGIQMHVLLEQDIIHDRYFTEKRQLYKLICSRVNQKFEEMGIKGVADPSVFSTNRLMRMPNTINRKPHKGNDMPAYVVQHHMEPQGFQLEKACGAPELSAGEHIHPSTWEQMPPPDTQGVLAECAFLRHCKANPEKISEPEWHAMVSITARLEDGRNLTHEMSKGHPTYDPRETEFKIEQTLQTGGPLKCETINNRWGGCKECPHWGKCVSPITIQTDEYIQTETAGFYYITLKENGAPNRVPAYEDIVKFFKKKYGGFFYHSGKLSYAYNREDHTWKPVSEATLEQMIYDIMDPKPRTGIVQEAVRTIYRATHKNPETLTSNTYRKLNLKNGVFNLDTMKLEERNMDQFFTYQLPYAYDPTAKAPRFEQFIEEITCGDKELAAMLLEYMGYAISGDNYIYHKILILYGIGRNGKSTFNDVLKALVGNNGYSSLSISALNNDQKRAMLEGKLFNVGDENLDTGFIDSSIIKALSAGEEYDVKHVYAMPYVVKNRTKLIFNCNEMPIFRDTSHGLFARLLLAGFSARFDAGKADEYILDKLKKELPGILNLCIAGYVRLKAQHGFTKVRVSEEMIQEYNDDLDPSDRWISNFILQGGEEDFASSRDTFKSYIQFCEREGIKYPKSKVHIGRAINRRITSWGGMNKLKAVNGEKVRGFSHTKLRIITSDNY